MRKTAIAGVGAAVVTAVIGFAVPAMATGSSSSSSSDASSSSSSKSSSSSSSSPTKPVIKVQIQIKPSSVVRGGTVEILTDPVCLGNGTVSSDAFVESTVVMPKHDAPFPVKIRSDAKLGAHAVVATCDRDWSRASGAFTVVAQTTTKPSGGVATGGGGAADQIGTDQIGTVTP